MIVTDDDPIGREFKEKASNLITDEIYSHTLPLFTPARSKKGFNYIKSLGSGVFVCRDDQFFILTAAHVVNQDKAIMIDTVAGVIPLHGAMVYFAKNSTIDVAVIAVPKGMDMLLYQKITPLPYNKILLDHVPIEFNHYGIIGYPAAHLTRALYKSQSYLVKGASSKVYNYNSLKQGDYYILDMHGKTVGEDGKKVRLRQPHGISGCGLWFIEHRIIGGIMRLNYHLIGLMTEVRKAKFNMMLATNIKYAMYPVNTHSWENP